MKPGLLMIGLSLLLAGCGTLDNSAGRSQGPYQDVRAISPGVSGVGIESQDIVGMTDEMIRDILTLPQLMSQDTPPRIVIDSEYFYNESTSRINVRMITTRLRQGLHRAARGKVVFVGRHFSNMVEKERQMKRDGAVDGGTIRSTKATAGADYRLGGVILSHDAINPETGMKVRAHEINFELMDLEYGDIIWSGIYEFKKASRDDILYR